MRNEAMRRFIGRNKIARTLTFGMQNILQTRLLSGHKHPETLGRLRDCRKRAHSLLSADESFIVHEIASAQSRLPGDFAEFGVYRGASAHLIGSVKGARRLHLFDTFDGLPDMGGKDEPVFHKGQFTGTLNAVRDLMRNIPDVAFHQGMFPDSTAGLEQLRFSFVHLDVDLHDATLAGLRYFYPRMVPGGIILTHDYSIVDGVRRAFRTFLADRPEGVIELPTTQAMIVRQAADHAQAMAA